MLYTENIESSEIQRVDILKANEEPEWNLFVSSHPDATIYHSLKYIKILANESGTENINLVYRDTNGKIKGILPLLYTRGVPFGFGGLPGSKRLSSLPRTPAAGPLATSDEVRNALIDKAIELVDKERGYRLQLKMTEEILNFNRNKFKQIKWRETYLFEIPSEGEELRFGNSRNHSAIKRAVGKAMRSGLTIKTVTSLDQLKAWYSMYLETMSFHVTPARSFDFFKNLWEALAPQKLMWVDLAVLNETEVLAGSVFLASNDTVIYGFNGSKRDLFDFRPNDLLHWNAIHLAQKQGYRYYDMGEVQADHEGLAAYKSKWCNLTKTIYHYYYPVDEKNIEVSIDTAPSGKAKKIIWNMVPHTLTEIMGKVIYKYL